MNMLKLMGRSALVALVPAALGCYPGPYTDTMMEGTEATSSDESDAGDDSDSDGSTTGTTTDSDDSETAGPMSECGNGFTEAGEQCDDGNDDNDDGCSNECTEPVCGDMMIQGTEECEDGNDNDLDDCSNECMITYCGDEIAQEGEECDDGNDDNTDGCVDMCTLARCGDGFIEDGVEGCDDGEESATCNADCTVSTCGDGVLNVLAGEQCDDGGESELCNANCTVALCGDGLLNKTSGEQCDDGNEQNTDDCSTECTQRLRRVFVTSEAYSGDLGGLAGADARCMELAAAAGMDSTEFMAWVSNENGSPATRFKHSSNPYVLVTGQKIADDWDDLVDGSLDHPIDVTEYGDPPPFSDVACPDSQGTMVWSATKADGTWVGFNACAGFTSAGATGRWGESGQLNEKWSDWCSGGTCSWFAPIYCFEQ